MAGHTKKTFEMVAKALKAQREGTSFDDFEQVNGSASAAALFRAACDHLAEDFANQFARENSNFNRGRFLRACGMNEPLRV